jgi:hypothetical protein
LGGAKGFLGEVGSACSHNNEGGAKKLGNEILAGLLQFSQEKIQFKEKPPGLFNDEPQLNE